MSRESCSSSLILRYMYVLALSMTLLCIEKFGRSTLLILDGVNGFLMKIAITQLLITLFE